MSLLACLFAVTRVAEGGRSVHLARAILCRQLVGVLMSGGSATVSAGTRVRFGVVSSSGLCRRVLSLPWRRVSRRGLACVLLKTLRGAIAFSVA